MYTVERFSINIIFNTIMILFQNTLVKTTHFARPEDARGTVLYLRTILYELFRSQKLA